MLPSAYKCDSCSYTLALDSGQTTVACPNCGAEGLHRASIFGLAGPRTVEQEDFSASLEMARESTSGDTPTLAFRVEGNLELWPLERGCHRVGRGVSAELRLDDPTVSRHHALIAVNPNGITIYDDRSTNGTFVNGERVDEAVLQDGDDIVVGRFHLHLIDNASAHTSRPEVHLPA